MKKLVQYVKKNGRMLGCLVAIGYDEHGGYAIGWSKHNRLKEEKSFNKKKALEIATGRAMNDSPMVWIDWQGDDRFNFPNSFKTDIEFFIERCQRYFKDKHRPRNWMA